ncbi:MAG: hypothetical protein IJZ82_03440 [Lachnospiraceae bacterium]|nr:hypothetical protein [Lachnospiraceae bacterium]
MEKDLVDYAYLSDNVRYADLFNGVLFGGEQVLDAEVLAEADVRSMSRGKKRSRTRDVVRKHGKNTNYAVLGVENQEEVSYCMPLRILEYETAEYARQMAAIRKRNKAGVGLSPGEFLERYRKLDRINPCVSLVLFWGEAWDGPETLKEMMNLEDFPEHLRDFVNDYSIHLVNVREFEDTSVFKTDLKLVFDFLKCADSKEKMKALVEDNPAYKDLDEDTYDVMMVHAHSKELQKLRENVKESEGNMCKALADWAAEEREIGREEGIEQGILLCAYKMIACGSVTVKEALAVLNLNGEEAEFVKEMQAAGYQLP